MIGNNKILNLEITDNPIKSQRSKAVNIELATIRFLDEHLPSIFIDLIPSVIIDQHKEEKC